MVYPVSITKDFEDLAILDITQLSQLKHLQHLSDDSPQSLSILLVYQIYIKLIYKKVVFSWPKIIFKMVLTNL